MLNCVASASPIPYNLFMDTERNTTEGKTTMAITVDGVEFSANPDTRTIIWCSDWVAGLEIMEARADMFTRTFHRHMFGHVSFTLR